MLHGTWERRFRGCAFCLAIHVPAIVCVATLTESSISVQTNNSHTLLEFSDLDVSHCGCLRCSCGFREKCKLVHHMRLGTPHQLDSNLKLKFSFVATTLTLRLRIYTPAHINNTIAPLQRSSRPRHLILVLATCHGDAEKAQ